MFDPIKNFFVSPLLDLSYVVESSDWSIKWDGIYLTKNLNKSGLLRAGVTTSNRFLNSKIIHFGSAGTFIDDNGIKFSGDKGSKIVLTWFHVAQGDPRNKFAMELNEKVDLLHTSCKQTKDCLLDLGIKEDKIVIIPLGIDLENFKVLDNKEEIRKEIGIPKGKFVIGSFQKDGNGWGEGFEPKLVKGPDVFCDVVEKIAKEIDIHVLLTGPARGYVKNRLEQASIPFTHKFLDDYLDIVQYYNALDLCLVSSRAEGGPKAILESMACGVPLVSTEVGMAQDYIIDEENGMLCEVDGVNCLVEKIFKLFGDEALKNRLISKGLEDVCEFDIRKISKQYYEKIYKEFI